MTTYFITGATGVVGSMVINRLLSDSDARLNVLVRAVSRDEAAKRLNHTLAALSVSQMTLGDRACVFAGDAERPHFGLSERDYDVVAKSTTHIIHCAGAVRMNLALADARRAALEPASNIVELARLGMESGLLHKCEVVSTVGVAGRDIRRVPESWIREPRSFHNTYEQAKAEAESRIEAAVQDGVPITLHRPSMVVGDSISGKILRFQIFYHLVEFLSGRRTWGFFPRFGGVKLDVIPVDFVAQALLWSSRTNNTTGRVLHLSSGPEEAVPLVDLQRLVRQAAQERGLRLPALRSIPRRVFRTAAAGLGLVARGRTKTMLNTLGIFLDYLESSQSFDNASTRAILEGAGIQIPPAKEYLPRVLNHYFARSASSGAAA